MPVEDFDIAASWAAKPFFYTAPFPDNIDPTIWPRSYQHAGAEFCIARDHALIGDAPGLGKTLQSILVGNAIGAKKTLVVCPASLRLNWERECWKYSTIPNVSTYPILKASDGVSGQAHYSIVSWALLANKHILAALMAERWDHVILDEAHAMKDPKGNTRTKAVVGWMDKGTYVPGLADVAGRITALSGTILPNQPVECLGADTLVLTNRGWCRIVDVELRDTVWDGVEWVAHSGLVFRGVKDTINLAGVVMTPDHEMLTGDGWQPALSLAQCESTMRHALATATANLPCSTSCSGHRGASTPQSYSAIADRGPSHLPRRASGREERASAGPAELRRAFAAVESTASTSPYAPTMPSESGRSAAFRTSCKDATTRTCPAITHTAAEAFLFGRLGASGKPDAESSLRMSSASRGGTSPSLSLTGSTLTRGTSRAICASLPSVLTPATGAHSGECSSVSSNLRPVYDLVNAGPRQRFTVLSDRGPLIAHNCYNIIRLLDHKAIDFASLDDFREHYYDFGEGFITVPKFIDGRLTVERKWSSKVRNVPRHMDDLQFRLRKHVMVRRLKEQVLTELPPKVWHPFPLVVDAAIRTALKHPGWDEAARLYDMNPDAFDGGIPVDGAISTARRLLGEAKAPAVADYIDDLIDGGVRKIVVGAMHRSVLDILRKRLDKHGLVYMDGGSSTTAKQRAVDDFQTKDDIGVILGQTQVIGEGFTLTVAQDAVLAEPDYVPGRSDQFLDRIHRMGQRGAYLIGHVPVVSGTIDERIISTAIRKDKAIHAALDKR